MKLPKLFKREEPPIRENLKYAFTDPKGRKGKRHYYQFESFDRIPIERIAKIQTLNLEITKAITKDEMNNLLDLADGAIHKGLSNPKEAARVTAILNEMRLRNTQIASLEVYYGYLAACYIREDENPMRFNVQAQKEKAEAFKGAANDYNSFFFALPEYKRLCELLNILTIDWQMVIDVSQSQQTRNQQALNILKS